MVVSKGGETPEAPARGTGKVKCTPDSRELDALIMRRPVTLLTCSSFPGSQSPRLKDKGRPQSFLRLLSVLRCYVISPEFQEGKGKFSPLKQDPCPVQFLFPDLAHDVATWYILAGINSTK